ncbi:MAG: hypothetical protein LBT87_11260 [Treponema sp.]|jgi:hypothetical protein|nr:hypothetical protein [Treponema sp.]
MARKKKPSIYDDRSSIGSSKELDEYGVWVKSEPRDINGGESDFSLPGFSADTDSLPDFDLNLEDPPSFSEDFSIEEEESVPAASGGDEEALSIADLDKTADEFNIDLPDLPVEDTGSDFPDLSDLPDLSDFSDFSSEEEPASSGGNLYEDLSLDTDIDKDITNSEGLSLSEGDFDLSSDSGDSVKEEAGIDAGTETAPDSDDETGFTEVPLEDILGDISFDIPTEANPEETPAAGEEKGASADLSTELLKKIAEELSSIRSELSALKDEFSVIRGQTLTAEDASRGHGGFFDQEEDDKIALTGDELNNIISTADFTEEVGADASEAVSGAEDLPLPEGEDLSLPEGEELSLSEEENFLLSGGGELILPQGEDLSVDADIGAEAGPVEEAGAAVETAAEELPALGETAEDLAAFMDTDAPSGGEVETAGDEVLEMADFGDLDLSFGETGETLEDELNLDEPANNDLLIDDISFEGLETEDTEDEEGIDLSDAVIDEPDLGAEIQENPVEEPPEDISLDLEELDEEEEAAPDETETEALAEEEIDLSGPEEASEAELPADLSLEESALEDSLDQVIPEGFEIESENSPAPFVDDIEEQESFEDTEAGELSPAEEVEDAPEEDFAESPGEDLAGSSREISGNLKQEIKTVLSYMDKLLEALPEKKIEEFAKSEYFDTYKKLFKELGLV